MAAGGKPQRASKARDRPWLLLRRGILSEEVMCPNLHFERHSLTSGFRIASGAELEWKQGFQIRGCDPTKRQEDRSAKKWSELL